MTLLIIILIVGAVILITWYLAKPKTHPVIRPGAPSHDGPKPLPMVQPIQGLKTQSGSERQKPPVTPASPAGGPPTPPAPPFPPSNPPTQTL